VNTLDDDFYIFDEKNYCLVGRHSHRKFQLGEEVRVQIAKANLEKKQLDFRLIRENQNERPASFHAPKKKSRR